MNLASGDDLFVLLGPAPESWGTATKAKPDTMIHTSRAGSSLPVVVVAVLGHLPADADVDPLIRQKTLGHKPTDGNGLGMTASYTHTRGPTQGEQIERALRRWPESLRYGMERTGQQRPAH